MKQEYIMEINKLMKSTDDIATLDLVYQILWKQQFKDANAAWLEGEAA